MGVFKILVAFSLKLCNARMCVCVRCVLCEQLHCKAVCRSTTYRVKLWLTMERKEREKTTLLGSMQKKLMANLGFPFGRDRLFTCKHGQQLQT